MKAISCNPHVPGMTGQDLAAAAAAWLKAGARWLRAARRAVLEALVVTSKAGALTASGSRPRRRF